MPLIIYLLALAIFCMTTSEFMVAGMMNELALAFQVSVSSIGYLITAYAGAMVVGGPILTATLLRIRSKQALLFLMFVFLIGQSLGAIAWNYDMYDDFTHYYWYRFSLQLLVLPFPFLQHWFPLIQGEKLHLLFLQV